MDCFTPKKHVDKVYLAYIEGTLPKDAAEQMKNGVILEDGVKTRPAELICLSREEGGTAFGTCAGDSLCRSGSCDPDHP